MDKPEPTLGKDYREGCREKAVSPWGHGEPLKGLKQSRKGLAELGLDKMG